MIYLNQTYELLAGGFYVGNPSWNKMHTDIDNCFKVYHLTEGSVHICSGQDDFMLENGKMYFINGSKLSRQYCKDSFSTHWLHFLPKDLMIYQGLLEQPAVVELEIDRISLASLNKNINKLLHRTNISSWDTSLSVMYVQTLIQNVVLALIKNSQVSELSTEICKLEPAIHYMNVHYKKTIHLDELAYRCHVSPNYFHKRFKQAFKMTPANYIILLRMKSALHLLADKRNMIKEIAFELGFTDHAHFCKTFKKYYGITPREYQRTLNNII